MHAEKKMQFRALRHFGYFFKKQILAKNVSYSLTRKRFMVHFFLLVSYAIALSHYKGYSYRMSYLFFYLNVYSSGSISVESLFLFAGKQA